MIMDKAEVNEMTEKEHQIVKEIFEEIENEIRLSIDSNYKALRGCKEECFNSRIKGKITALWGIDDYLVELKKKYLDK